MATSKKATPKKSNPAADALHKLFLAGLGLADETNQKLHQTFNDLVRKGKAKEPEVKKAVEDVRKKAMAKRKELEKKFSNLVGQNELVKSKEFKDLMKKLETLEKKAKETFSKKPAQSAAKPAAAKKKSAPKKKPAAKKKPAPAPAAQPGT